ncbi:hypothetical protein [Engelhardtia mirabilis]|uniref:Kelch motif protein n=1 Tax=Engelhardtia mirabilis TaxID=2528011 RepID=A0A518BKX5_9BACT|nr:Kelch motif protein [Planctomycetes bacterium Pla133]QDV01951.1 Kelch motif protein [Planctomycetes bacterium Pla86]
MTPTRVLSLALLLAAPVAAQTSELSRGGGAIPGSATWSVAGDPGQIYAIVVALDETPTEILPGVSFAISDALLDLTFTLPGFIGLLDGSGNATASVPMVDPGLAGLVISAQAVTGPTFGSPSNLVRTTPAVSGTFAATVEAPALPILGGAISQLPNGDLLLAGGSGPAAQRYTDELERFELDGLTFGVGLLSQATALADGRVLFSGGLGLDGQPTDACAVFDPTTGDTTELTMGSPRAGHQATLLSDGRVFLTGGFGDVSIDFTAILTDPLSALSVFNGLLASTEFFDPASLTFAGGPNMLEPRALHTATALNNGSILVAGGMTLIPILNIPTVSATAYTYSTLLGVFGLPIFFDGPRLAHSAIKMADGSVILVGGITLDLEALITSGGDLTQIAIGARDDVVRYTSGLFSGGFSTVGTLSEPRALSGLALLPDGRALIAGGFRATLSSSAIDLGAASSADLYQVGSGVSVTGSMAGARTQPLLANLADGTVLVVGGGPSDAEIYQP